MRNLDLNEMTFVSGGRMRPANRPYAPGQHPRLRNPAHAPGNSYKGPADEQFPKR